MKVKPTLAYLKLRVDEQLIIEVELLDKTCGKFWAQVHPHRWYHCIGFCHQSVVFMFYFWSELLTLWWSFVCILCVCNKKLYLLNNQPVLYWAGIDDRYNFWYFGWQLVLKSVFLHNKTSTWTYFEFNNTSQYCHTGI